MNTGPKGPEQLIETHTPQGVSERLKKGTPQSYLKDMVYGGVDGTITTFAIVSGVVGADLASGIVVILGLANLIACLLYTSPSPRDRSLSRMPSSA